MDIKTVPRPPHSPDVAPCDFWLFPKLRGCRYETIEEIKEAVTLTQEDFHGVLAEVIGTVKQVYCSSCTINKSAHTKKVWKLI